MGGRIAAGRRPAVLIFGALPASGLLERILGVLPRFALLERIMT
jgi:hypothetical protein